MITCCFVNYSSSIEYWTPELAWLSFKSYFEDNSPHKDKVRFPFPFHSSVSESNDPKELGDKILAENPDVVGFSLYLWNVGLSKIVAEYIKSKNPDIKIIVGGPHTPYQRNPNYFKEMPYIDLVCNTDGYGEPFILDLLNQLCEDKYDPKDITFAVYPSKKKDMWFESKKNFHKREFKWPREIYKRNEEYIRTGNLHNGTPIVNLESSRGCPFGCVFCEWGGGISSKVTFKPTEYVIEDIDFVWDAIKPMSLDFTDANFGIIERDVDITRHICEKQKKDPILNGVSLYGPTKVNKENLYQILRLLIEVDLMKDASKIPVQSFDPAILKNIERTDAPWQESSDEIRKILSEYKMDGTEIRYELILGLPGETLESFYSDFDITGDVIPHRHMWWMLPTSPAASPAYTEKFKVKTVKSRYTRLNAINNRTAIYRNDFADDPVPELIKNPEYAYPNEVVVETYSYSKDDWIEMALVQGMVFSYMLNGTLYAIMKYIHRESNIPLSSFIRKFYQEFMAGDYMDPLQHKVFNEIKNDLTKKVHSEEAINLDYPDLSNVLPFNISARVGNAYIILQNMDSDIFYDGMLKWAKENWDDAGLYDAISWSKQAYVSLYYDPTVGKIIESEYDWVSYTLLSKPLVKKKMKWKAKDVNKYFNKGEPIEWHKYSMKDRAYLFLLPYSSDLFKSRFFQDYEVIDGQ